MQASGKDGVWGKCAHIFAYVLVLIQPRALEGALFNSEGATVVDHFLYRVRVRMMNEGLIERNSVGD